MCGIFAVIKPTNHQLKQGELRFLRNASIAGAVRGVDSMGYILGSLNQKDKLLYTNYYKTAENGTTCVTDKFDISTCAKKMHMVIGHKRAATVGNITDETAHPFNEGGLCGVHNGTLTPGWSARLQVSKTCPVDSQGLYRSMAARGVDWTLERAEGAMALMWQDVGKHRTYVYKNDERQLSYAEGHGGQLYIASEAGMLTWLLSRNHLTHKGVKAFKNYTLYDVSGGKLVELREIAKPAPAKYTLPKAKIGTVRTHRTTNAHMKYDNGIGYRGKNVPREDRERGITSEYVERGHHQYISAVTGQKIHGNFLEEATVPYSSSADKILESELDTYMVRFGAPDTEFRRILRGKQTIEAAA